MGKTFTRRRVSRKRYGGKKRSSFKKRRFTRRRRSGSNGKSNAFIVARRTHRTLTYHELITMDSGANSYAVYKFGANALYDPNTTGTGHQPYGFDQYMALYKYATVIGSKITLTPTQAAVSNTVPGYATIFLSEDGNVASTINDAATFWETQLRKAPIINVGEGGMKAWNFPTNKQTTATYSAKKFHGIKSLIGDAGYSNTSGANPVRNPQYELVYWSISGNNPDAQLFEVHIEYEVVFSEPITVGQS